MALTLTFNQPGIPPGDTDRGRTDILTTDAGGGRAPVVNIEIGNVPAGAVVLVQALDEPPSSSPLLTEVSDTLWTLEFNAGAWGPFRIQATAAVGTDIVSSVTRRISIRSPTFHLAYPALAERYDPNAHFVPTVPSVELTEMNEHSTNRPLVDFHRELVQAIDTLSAGGIASIPDGAITEAKLDPAYASTIVVTDGSRPMLAPFNAGAQRVTNVGAPTAPTDAARLQDAEYTAGAGLVRTGQTLDVAANADGSIVVNADDVQVGVLATDAQHGTRGGGTQHAAAVAAGAAGFMSGADKSKLNGIAAGADVTTVALAAAAAPLSVNNQRITQLGAPTVATDAARLQDIQDAAVIAGAGLVRAGNTLNAVADPDGSLVVAADSMKVGTLANDAQHGTRGGGTQHATVIAAGAAGFMSGADKSKLDGIAAGADVTTVALAAATAPISVNGQRITNLATPTAATDAATRAYVDAAPPVAHASTHADGGSDELNVAGLSGLLADPQTAGSLKTATGSVAIAASAAPSAGQMPIATGSSAAAWATPPNATTTTPGYLSAADKTRLDGMATGAAAVGASAATQITVTTAGAGAAATAARSDHVHSVATGAPSALTVGGAQAAGTSTSLVRQDHVHAMPGLVTGVADGFMAAGDKSKLDGVAASAAAVGSTAATQVNVTTAAAGAATTAARSDHVHSVATGAPSALTVGGAQAAGTSTSLVRQDHVHAMPGIATGAADGFLSAADKTRLDGMATGAASVSSTMASIVDTAAGDAGTSPNASRVDHRHQVRVGSPVALTIGGSNADGTSSSLVRADHTHALPAYGSAANTITQGNDARLSDSRAPNGAASGGLTGTYPGPTVAAVPASVVQTSLAAVASAVSINSQRLTNVADPTAAQDAATRAYVDALAQGLDVKASCRLVSTSNMGSLGGVQIIDGVTTQTGDRVLIAGQTAASANGIYVCSGVTWLRATDADTSAKVTAGMYTWITEGTTYGDSGWVLTTNDPITLGTTSLVFSQFSGAGQITAGAGLTKTGNQLDVGAHADGSIVVAADTVQVGVLATDAQHGTRGGGTLHAVVVAAGAAGFMSGADKTKLDGVAASAAAVGSTTPANVGTTGAAGAATTAARSDHVHAHGAQTDGTLHATVIAAGAAGFMSGADKTKLDNSASAAYVDALPIKRACRVVMTASTTMSGLLTIDGITVSAGDRVLSVGQLVWQSNGIYIAASGAWARAPDADIAAELPGGMLVPVGPDGTQYPNTLWQMRANDPVNLGTTTLQFALVSSTLASATSPNVSAAAAAIGTGVTAARQDHTHQVAAGSPVALTLAATTADGASNSLARADHVHALPASSTAPPALTVGGSSAAGSSTSISKADHVHALPAAGTPVALTLAGANAAGSAATLALSDHVHALPATAAPAALTVGAASSAGVAVTLPRSDHVHAMPGLAATGADGFMSSADKTKLNSLASAVTAIVGSTLVADGVGGSAWQYARALAYGGSGAPAWGEWRIANASALSFPSPSTDGYSIGLFIPLSVGTVTVTLPSGTAMIVDGESYVYPATPKLRAGGFYTWVAKTSLPSTSAATWIQSSQTLPELQRDASRVSSTPTAPLPGDIAILTDTTTVTLSPADTGDTIAIYGVGSEMDCVISPSSCNVVNPVTGDISSTSFSFFAGGVFVSWVYDAVHALWELRDSPYVTPDALVTAFANNTAVVDVNAQRLTNVASPTTATDAVPRSYLDTSSATQRAQRELTALVAQSRSFNITGISGSNGAAVDPEGRTVNLSAGSGALRYSTDLTVWSNATLGSSYSGTLQDILYNDTYDIFVVCGTGGEIQYAAPASLATWTRANTALAGTPARLSLAASGGTMVAYSGGAALGQIYSANSATPNFTLQTTLTPIANFQMAHIIQVGSTWIMSGRNANTNPCDNTIAIHTSTNLTTWTPTSLASILGTNYALQTSGLVHLPIWGKVFALAKDLVTAGQYRIIACSENAPTVWTTLATITGNSADSLSLAAGDFGLMLYDQSATNHRVYVSVDGGVTWSRTIWVKPAALNNVKLRRYGLQPERRNLDTWRRRMWWLPTTSGTTVYGNEAGIETSI